MCKMLNLSFYGMGIESALLFLTLFVPISLILVRKTRINFPYRVNCWFCNNSFWIKFQDRNSWTCKICEQYNGFNKDGDYNKPLPLEPHTVKTSPKSFGGAHNGLCMECNIRQELKVLYLADFVPLRNYDKEIETFRSQMEKYSKLCGPCRKVVQKKLRKDKNKLLLIPLTKTANKQDSKYSLLRSKIESAYIVIAGILCLLVSIDILVSLVRTNRSLFSITSDSQNVINIMKSMLSSVKIEMYTAFSGFEDIYNHISNTEFILYTSQVFSYVNAETMYKQSDLVQKFLGFAGLGLQITGVYLQCDTLRSIFDTLLWSMFVVASFTHFIVPDYPLSMFIIKDICVMAVLVLPAQTKHENSKDNIVENKTSPRGIRHLVTGKVDSVIDDEDSSDMETDDNVSLSKYMTKSSNDSNNYHNTMPNVKPFTYNDSIWTKPRLNPSFCVNAMTNKASSTFSNVSAKTKFDCFAKNQNYDLDESINSLYIGSPKKADSFNSNYFRSQNAPPRYTISPLSSVSQRRPLISPSRLGHSTSWVAGGYWDADGNKSAFSADGSPTSSQSSGFDSWSQTSSQRNLFSHPPSREESVCSEIDRTAVPSEAFRNCSLNNSFGQSFQNHRKMPLVYPELRYDGHVHIPTPRYSYNSQSSSNGMFGCNNSHQFQYVNTFKTPGGLGLNKFSRMN